MKVMVTVTITILLFLSCEDTRQNTQNFIRKDSLNKDALFLIPDVESEFLEDLYNDQMSISRYPASRSHIQKFISRAFFKEENALITFGNAKQINPLTGKQISIALIKRAALIDAKRWAAYGMHWLKNDLTLQFGTLNELYQGQSKELSTFKKGDSLIVVIANKVH